MKTERFPRRQDDGAMEGNEWKKKKRAYDDKLMPLVKKERKKNVREKFTHNDGTPI